jgi:asparagine N-glycosylation enzyme membrane subunit Stt3
MVNKMGIANQFLNDEKAQVSGPVMAVMTLILVGAILFVGVSVMDGIEESTGLSSGDTFYNTSEDITSGVESSFGMAGTLMLIVIATAILGALVGIVAFIR